MRWSYKSVHYELKKEGLLGNTFLDESEIELSLNEYGKAGWELISILETQEGLIAVFKQPLSDGRQTTPYSEEEAERPYVPLRSQKDEFRLEPESRKGGKQTGKSQASVAPVDDYEIVGDEQDEEEPKSRPAKDDIGSIVIE